jgi:putative transcriptional regulator
MNSIVGNLLIAPPAVKGTFWHKSVIMITEDHNHGSIGLVLNKRSTLTIEEFGQQLGIPLNISGYVYQGGPLNPQGLSFIHSNEWRSSNTLRLNDNFSLSSDEEILPRFSIGDTPKRWRMFLGISVWGPGQLSAELTGTPPWKKETSWCTVNSNPELVFETDQKEQWCNALDRSGLEFAQNILL